jgi:hypothetical protein
MGGFVAHVIVEGVRAAVLICVGALAGCRGLLGIDDPQLAADSGLSLDSSADAQMCFGPTTGQKVCLAALPADNLLIAGAIDTDTCAVKQMGYCVLAGINVTINDAQITGGLPLIIVATNQLELEGSLDVRAHGAQGGPGASVTGASSVFCANGPLGVNGLNGGGGGAGGSFHTRGGDGGGGDGGMNTGTRGGLTYAEPATLRAGCPGTRGLGGSMPGDPAGGAGGAVYVLGGNKMLLNGTINASGGGGGRGNASKSGGSGGGAGGMIVLWSPTLRGSATLIANGGGGGGGADNGASGGAGSDGTAITAAPGGDGGSPAVGRGGAGATGTVTGMRGTDDGTGAGGGAGGGGVGYIRLAGDITALSIMASPPVETD